MKKVLAILIFLLAFLYSQAQIEKAVSKSICNKFVKHYNAECFDSIHYMFSKEMREALPYDKTIDFLNDVRLQAGQIINYKFIRYEQKTYASYKTKFERAVFTINLSVNEKCQINGLYIKPFIEDSLPVIRENKTKLILPFNEEWYTVWGGDTKELNYHVENQAQKNAFDFIIKDSSGKSYKTTGHTNEDYYAFGKELIAPCQGEIVAVVDGIYDNKPGEFNLMYVPGNTVIMKTDNNEYLFFAHFKQHSIRVKQGQKVNQGDILGLCGNSGNSSEAHLHFHIQNVENVNIATGVKCYFENIIIDGVNKKKYSPIQNERVKNKD